MSNNNSLLIDKEKTEKLKKTIIKDLSNFGGKISIIPILGFEKWIIIIFLIKKDAYNKNLEIEYLSPIKFKKIKELIIKNDELPFWLNFLIGEDLFENLTNPKYIFNLLINELKNPEIIFNEIVNFRQKTAIIFGNDPLENVKEFSKYLILTNLNLDELYIPEKEYDLEKNSIEIDGKTFQVVNGYLLIIIRCKSFFFSKKIMICI